MGHFKRNSTLKPTVGDLIIVDNDPLISNHLPFNPQSFTASCVFLHLIHKDTVTGCESCQAVTKLSIARISADANSHYR